MGETITFNVVFTPGTARRLLPFPITLLQAPGVRLRLVANACPADEVELLRDSAAGDERVSFHVLPADHMLPHGEVLNLLFEAFPGEPYFAFIDSDVIADGDFTPGLLPLAPGAAGLSAAPPVWAAAADLVAPPGWPVLNGRISVLADGTPVGSTFLAIYDREAVEPAWRRAPRGFGTHFRHALPREMRAELSARGWDHRIFDTCRLVNVLLLLEGRALENRAVPHLHHWGAASSTATRGLEMLANLPRLLAAFRRSPRPTAERVGYTLLLWRKRRERTHRLLTVRRRTIGAYVDRALDAVIAGEPVPAAPPTDSADVDRRVAALVATLVEHYEPLT